jgi:pimeloyl-ACP methyl ester carboxylesterase
VTDRLIDVDGYRLAVRVTKSQGPAVVMLSSAGGGHEQWEQLRARLGDTLCVSYGRPGIDGSDPLPRTSTPCPGLRAGPPTSSIGCCTPRASRPASYAELAANPPPPLERAVVVSRAFGTVPSTSSERAWRSLTPTEADHGWRARQVQWARRLNAVHFAADTGGHHVQEHQPDLVAYLVGQVIAAHRTGGGVTINPARLIAAEGTRLS